MALIERLAPITSPSGVTTLAAAVTTATATTITTAAAAPMSLQGGPFRIRIDDEWLLVSSGQDTTTWTVVRGIEGSTATTHASAAIIRHVLTKVGLGSMIDTARITIPSLARTNMFGSKLRAVAFPSQPGGGSASLDNSQYWFVNAPRGYYNWDLTRVRWQMDRSLVLGANCVHIYGSGHQIIRAEQTIQDYQKNWALWMDETIPRQLYVYATLVVPEVFNLTGATTTLATIQTIMQAVAEVLDDYPNVVGINLFNEINNGGDTTWIAPTFPKIRAVTSKPLTVNWWCSAEPAVNATLDTIASLSDFLDFHPYYAGAGSPTAGPANLQASDFDSVAAAYKMPMWIGELSNWGSPNDQHSSQALTIAAMREVAERRDDFAGICVWPLHDYNQMGPTEADEILNGNGLIPSLTGSTNEYTGASYPFRTLPRRSRPTIQTIPLVTPSAPIPLTATLSTIPLSTFPLATAYYRASPGDPQYRVNGIFGGGIQTNDVLEVAIINVDTGVVQNSATDSVELTAGPTLSDSSPSAYKGALVGTGMSIASTHTGFTSELVTSVSGDRVEFPPITIPAGAFTVEGWFKKSRNGIFEHFIGRQDWSNAANSHFVVFTYSDNIVYGGAYNNAGAFIQAGGGAAITDTAWHHFALVNSGTNLFMMVDGTLRGTALAMTGPRAPVGVVPTTLANPHSHDTPFLGSLDELRISKTARYTTTTFTPPTAPFTSDANTMLLIHADAINTASSFITTQAASPWTYVQPTPYNAAVQIRNSTAVRGALLAANLEIRYY